MSALDDLKAALERLRIATACGANRDAAADRADLHALLTDDTIAALIAVAEEIRDEPPMPIGSYRNVAEFNAWREGRLRRHAALAPLVKEAPDDHA